jgi:hypothetical protein
MEARRLSKHPGPLDEQQLRFGNALDLYRLAMEVSASQTLK